MVEAKQHTT